MTNKLIDLARVNFFTWFLIWRVPGVRLLRHMMHCDENWELEQEYALAKMAKILESKFTEWVVIFPEVNIWTNESANAQQRMATRYCLPRLENLLYPRYSALYNVVQSVSLIDKCPLEDLYNISISYRFSNDQGEYSSANPTLFNIFCSHSSIYVLIHVSHTRIEKLPTRRSRFERYVERMWIFKDSVVGELYRQEVVFSKSQVPQPKLFDQLITPFLSSSRTSNFSGPSNFQPE